MAVAADRMHEVHREVRTPYKFGKVLHAAPGATADAPSVFRHGGAWYLVYVSYDRKLAGYRTELARSADLIGWTTIGTILAPRRGHWDGAHAAGYVALQDPAWGGSYTLLTHDRRYWLSYLGGRTPGYEEGELGIGMAHADDPAAPGRWQRLDGPVLSPTDDSAGSWERHKLYKSNVIHDGARALGARYVMFYNATASRGANSGAEHIGVAVSDDMTRWRRYLRMPLISPPGRYAKRAVADPQVVRIGDTWVMFFWCRFAGDTGSYVFDTFACSYDLVNWTAWDGEPLVTASRPFDAIQAHKPWIVKWRGTVYHFYGANGADGFGIGLATSGNPVATSCPTNPQAG